MHEVVQSGSSLVVKEKLQSDLGVKEILWEKSWTGYKTLV